MQRQRSHQIEIVSETITPAGGGIEIAPGHKSINRALTLSSIFFIGLWLASYLTREVYSSLNFDGFPANGPFQLFDPLRRIADGQTAGVHFQFFHGLGVPYLHYPLFALFGKSIFASELSRNLTSAICYLASLAVFARVAVGKNLRKILYFITLAVCASEFFSLEQAGVPFNMLFTPGNSLLGVRSTLPIISFALLLSETRPALKAIFAGICFAFSFFISTEHGIALIASFTAVGGFVMAGSILSRRSLKTHGGGNLSPGFYLTTLFSAACGIVLVYLVFCGYRGGVQALKYNLIDVPSDQFWYFGVPPNDFASSLLDYPGATWRGTLLIIAVLFWLGHCLIGILRLRAESVTVEAVTVTHMLFYGLLSCASSLGMLDKGYFFPLIRIVMLIVLMLAFRKNWPEKAISYIRLQSRPLRSGLLTLLTAFILISFGSLCWIFLSKMPGELKINPGKPLPQFSAQWDKYLTQTTAAIDRLSDQKGGDSNPVIWSTYSGLLEDHYHVFHPAEDYIIHALGPERRKRYLETFRLTRPEIVQTVRRSLFIAYAKNRDYEQWLQNTSWDFYEEVLSNYEILSVSDMFFTWKRTAYPWVSPDQHFDEFPLSPGVDSLQIPAQYAADQPGILVVRLRYRTNNPWRKIPVLGSLPRYLVIPENAVKTLPISAAPYASEIRFPLLLKPGTAPQLKFQTRSPVPGADFTVESIAFKRLPLKDNQRRFLED
ncbi:MAG TPA: hypothetical protein VFD58_08535 [Blastocatellia bacterium]|nr:hypothetical protein [Blastocatellia bacterium]